MDTANASRSNGHADVSITLSSEQAGHVARQLEGTR
jgi:hypothetical protein